MKVKMFNLITAAIIHNNELSYFERDALHYYEFSEKDLKEYYSIVESITNLKINATDIKIKGEKYEY